MNTRSEVRILSNDDLDAVVGGTQSLAFAYFLMGIVKTCGPLGYAMLVNSFAKYP